MNRITCDATTCYSTLTSTQSDMKTETHGHWNMEAICETLTTAHILTDGGTQ
ncbi:hypothetical protein Smp_184400 [Schistosoma mansoni]|uniref:hypothetical protein n=1 Tax=Schistosoma mansoni TaxID=6183 RepID=UPI00022C86A9|nr:hypothetical protein Smp_184400 [Schistosoma mansoni]|eukprot:XP_018644056.1 hypothetical protein Smp_184400 [Schistosoma mansoni]